MLNVEVIGQAQFERAMEGVIRSLGDLRPFWKNVEPIYANAVREQFETQGSKSGGWAELSTAYAATKALVYPGQPILQASGALYDSLTDPFDENAIVDEGEDYFTRGSSLPYAVFHQTGTSRMPARPPVAFDDQDKQAMAHALLLGLSRQAQELGFEVTR